MKAILTLVRDLLVRRSRERMIEVARVTAEQLGKPVVREQARRLELRAGDDVEVRTQAVAHERGARRGHPARHRPGARGAARARAPPYEFALRRLLR